MIQLVIGSLPSVELVSLYSKASLTPSETAEATQLLASLRANAAVKKWADLSLNNPARCSDLEAIAKNAPMASEEQARALAPIATKILNQCATSNGLVPGVWAGLFQEDALSSVLLDDEVLPRSSSTVLGILGGVAIVGGVVLAIAFPPAAPEGIAIAIFGGGLVATAIGKKKDSCLDCGTRPDGSFNCGTGCNQRTSHSR
jgi:hypothetical protein